MKTKIVIVSMFALSMILANAIVTKAQSVNESPVWISKDVQKVANKQALENKDFEKSNVTAQSLDASWVVSKGVKQNNNNTEVTAQGNIPSEGTPTWAISKDVKKDYNRKFGNSSEKSNYGTPTWIISKGVKQQGK